MKKNCSLYIYVLGKQDKRQKPIQPNAFLSFRITNPQVRTGLFQIVHFMEMPAL